MALNIGASGTSRPYVKYNAKADKWFIRAEGGGDLEIARTRKPAPRKFGGLSRGRWNRR